MMTLDYVVWMHTMLFALSVALFMVIMMTMTGALPTHPNNENGTWTFSVTWFVLTLIMILGAPNKEIFAIYLSSLLVASLFAVFLGVMYFITSYRSGER